MFLLLKNRSENNSKILFLYIIGRYLWVDFPVLIALVWLLNCGGEMAEFRIACYTLKNKGSLSVFMVT